MGAPARLDLRLPGSWGGPVNPKDRNLPLRTRPALPPLWLGKKVISQTGAAGSQPHLVHGPRINQRLLIANC